MSEAEIGMRGDATSRLTPRHSWMLLRIKYLKALEVEYLQLLEPGTRLPIFELLYSGVSVLVQGNQG
jgi:hypothetical protein